VPLELTFEHRTNRLKLNRHFPKQTVSAVFTCTLLLIFAPEAELSDYLTTTIQSVAYWRRMKSPVGLPSAFSTGRQG
ncbi:MAG: hypothetical protein LBF62_09095, partial [Tannerellaceae bacterium]|nr:hypothetical protein [Tannerellaceae bacterium]